MNKKIYLLACAPFAVLTGTYGFAGLFVPMATELNVSVGAIAQLLTVFALAAALCGPVLMSYFGQKNSKYVLVTALLSLSLLDFLSSQVRSFEVLLILRLFSGVAASQVFPLAQTMATFMAPLEVRGRTLSKVLLGNTAALIIGIPLSTYVGNLYGWRATFCFCSILTFAIAIGIMLVMEQIPNRSSSTGLSALAIVTRPAVLTHLLINLFANAASRAALALLSPIAIIFAGFAAKSVSFLQIVAGIATFIGGRVGGFLADKRDKKMNMPIMMSGLGLSVFLFSLLIMFIPNQGINSYALFTISLFGAEFFLFAFFPNVQHSIVSESPDNRATLLSLSAAYGQLGQAIGAAIAGFIYGVGAIRFVGIAATSLTIIGLLLCLILVKISRFKNLNVPAEAQKQK